MCCTYSSALQWVHGQITVVMRIGQQFVTQTFLASMGPRSDNRGYVREAVFQMLTPAQLQWVHGQITVVMDRDLRKYLSPEPSFNGSSVR